MDSNLMDEIYREEKRLEGKKDMKARKRGEKSIFDSEVSGGEERKE